jgi:hypothetical protein
MTEAEWLACADPAPMLRFLRHTESDRKLRLFAAACCRRIWHLLADERSRRAVEVAECYVDGLTSKAERAAAYAEASAAASATCRIESGIIPGGSSYAYLAHDAGGVAASAAADVLDYDRFAAPDDVARLAVDAAANPYAEAATQASVLRDIFGNPFNPSPSLPASVLVWNDGTVQRLAQAIYEERQLPAGTLDAGRLAILADALLDAGCEDEELLAHLRSPGPHVSGCWAVDALLGKS